MKKITAALLGAGSRGAGAYGTYALGHPHEIQFVAVADPNVERRESFKKLHNVSDENSFETMDELLEKPKMADVMIICTQDKMHFEPAIKAMEKGYHVLLEKPMSPDPKECILLGEYAKKHNVILSICHVLRYTPFFGTIKKLLTEGRIGKLISIQHNENVGYYHQAHSYVRGNWRNLKESSPMILAKSCHDMDILLWLADSNCKRISSFGSLTHFKEENAPEGAPKRCLDGCPAETTCPFYAPKQYLTSNTGWPTSLISEDKSLEARTKALKEGPYGRCVYHCDNDVVDHQVVNMEFENEVTASFTMCAFTNEVSRTIKLMGTKGEIRASHEKHEIMVIDFATGTKEVISLKKPTSGHGGGDAGIMHSFVRLIQNQNEAESLTSADVSIQSHIMAFAAEESRVIKKVIEIDEYIQGIKNNI
jgi:predicted dehydrogenase